MVELKMLVKQVTWNSWDVSSESGESPYMVALTPYESCTCMWYTISAKLCKHILAVKTSLNSSSKKG